MCNYFVNKRFWGFFVFHFVPSITFRKLQSFASYNLGPRWQMSRPCDCYQKYDLSAEPLTRTWRWFVKQTHKLFCSLAMNHFCRLFSLMSPFKMPSRFSSSVTAGDERPGYAGLIVLARCQYNGPVAAFSSLNLFKNICGWLYLLCPVELFHQPKSSKKVKKMQIVSHLFSNDHIFWVVFLSSRLRRNILRTQFINKCKCEWIFSSVPLFRKVNLLVSIMEFKSLFTSFHRWLFFRFLFWHTVQEVGQLKETCLLLCVTFVPLHVKDLGN